MDNMQTIPLSSIDDSAYQTRLEIDEEKLNELVKSVSSIGVLQPISVRKNGEKYTIISGHRRFLAAQRCALVNIPAVIVDADPRTDYERAIAENLFRADLSAMEEACMVDDLVRSGDYTVEEVAAMVHRSASWVHDRQEIAHWPDDVSVAVHRGLVSLAAARHLAAITDEHRRKMLVDYACENGATARVTLAWFQAWKMEQDVSEPGEISPAPAGESLPPIEPYTPCVVCGKQFKMTELRYSPVCSHCGGVIVEVARQMRQTVPDGL